MVTGLGKSWRPLTDNLTMDENNIITSRNIVNNSCHQFCHRFLSPIFVWFWALEYQFWMIFVLQWYTIAIKPSLWIKNWCVKYRFLPGKLYPLYPKRKGTIYHMFYIRYVSIHILCNTYYLKHVICCDLCKL